MNEADIDALRASIRKVTNVSGQKTTAGRRRTKAGRPTSEELARRKARVMEVATALFLERGYAETSLVDIARESGVATRTLYQHYHSKEWLFFEVVKARAKGNVPPPVSLEQYDSARDALLEIARYIYAFSFRPKVVDFVRLLITEGHRFPEFMRALDAEVMDVIHSNLSAMFQQLIDRGLTPRYDPRESANLLLDLVVGRRSVAVYAGWSSDVPSDVELASKVDLLVRGRFQ